MKQNLLKPQSYKFSKITSISGLNKDLVLMLSDLVYTGNIDFGFPFVNVNILVPRPPVVMTAVFTNLREMD